MCYTFWKRERKKIKKERGIVEKSDNMSLEDDINDKMEEGGFASSIAQLIF
jgi:hypothetical protein